MSQCGLISGQTPAALQGERRSLDLYPTDVRVCRATLRELVKVGWLYDGATVCEPHVGRGDWLTALDQVGTESGHRYLVAVHDIDPRTPGMVPREVTGTPVRVMSFGDLLDKPHRLGILEHWGERFDLVVGNPPYSVVRDGKSRGIVVAHLHVEACRELARHTCLVLRDGLEDSSGANPARMAWGTEPQHQAWFELKLVPRPGFTGDGRLGPFGSVASGYGPALMPPPTGWTMKSRIDWRVQGAWDEVAS